MLEPQDAYVAVIADDGAILVGVDLSDPACKPILVVEFIHDRDLYRAIYHEDFDVWEYPEWVGRHDSRNDYHGKIRRNCFYAAFHGEYLHSVAEKTARAYKDKLLAGPCPDRLKGKLADDMTKEMLEELDREILRDLHAVNGLPPPQFPPLPGGLVKPLLAPHYRVDNEPVTPARKGQIVTSKLHRTPLLTAHLPSATGDYGTY